MESRASIRCGLALVVAVGVAACAATEPKPRPASAPLPAQGVPRPIKPVEAPLQQIKPKDAAVPLVVQANPAPGRRPQLEGDRSKGSYELALQQLQGGQPAAAEQNLREVIKGQAPPAGAYANLAVLRLRVDDGVEAEQLLLEAIKRSEKNADYQNLLGIALRQQGRFPQAKEAYERALQLDASHANAVLNLGILYDLYLADLVNAKRYYESYIKMRPEDAKTIGVWLGDIEQRIGKK